MNRIPHDTEGSEGLQIDYEILLQETADGGNDRGGTWKLLACASKMFMPRPTRILQSIVGATSDPALHLIDLGVRGCVQELHAFLPNPWFMYSRQQVNSSVW